MERRNLAERQEVIRCDDRKHLMSSALIYIANRSYTLYVYMNKLSIGHTRLGQVCTSCYLWQSRGSLT